MVPIISDSKRSATRQFALGPMNLFRAGNASHLAERIDAWIENPQGLIEVGNMYSQHAKEYLLERSIKQIEKVYRLAGNEKSLQNRDLWRVTHRFFSNMFYYFIAIPILFIWTRVVLGVKYVGEKRLRKLDGAITVCNHVHLLDCAPCRTCIFPRKLIFPTLKKNVESLWPGKIVKLLGGVAIPGSITELKRFLAEMEYLLFERTNCAFFS